MFKYLSRRIEAIVRHLLYERNLFGRPATIAVLVITVIHGLFWLNWRYVHGSIPSITELDLLVVQFQLPFGFSRSYDVLLGSLVLLINAMTVTGFLFETFDEDDPNDWRDIILAIFLAISLLIGIVLGTPYFLLILSIGLVVIIICSLVTAISAMKSSSQDSSI